MFHRKYKDKSFSGVNKKQVFLRNEFLCKTSFPAKLNPPFCQSSFLLKIPHPAFLANFWRSHLPLNLGEDFPAMKGVLRELTLSPYHEFFEEPLPL